jgi:hypothetical protein
MTTLTQPLEISVLTAPIAAIDRRAISQAWYSALGLARTGTARASDGALRSAGPASGYGCRSEEHFRGAPLQVRSHAQRRCFDFARSTRRAQDDEVGVRIDRRTPTRLARGIERKLLLKPRTPARTTVTIEGERGRVYLTLQSRGKQLRIVAICSKRLSGHVARALDEVRVAACT